MRNKTVGRPSSVVTLFLMALALSGCGTQPLIEESNYLTYEHPFTEAAAESARKNAEKVCAERKLIAVRSERTCSLKTCTTSFQCVDGLQREQLLRGK